jgi:hypothetical protein
MNYETGKANKTTKPGLKVISGRSMTKRSRLSTRILMVLLILSGMCILSLAADGDEDNSSLTDKVVFDPLKEAVSGGITGFIISMCDDVFGHFTEGAPEDISFNDPISEGIYLMATYSMDPFDLKIVKETAQTSAVFWFVGMLLFLGYGLLLLVVAKYSQTATSSILFITKSTPIHSAQQYFKWSVTGILLGLVFYTGCVLTILLSGAMTSLFMVAALPAIAPTPDNIILYCMVATLYLFMLIFFAIRTLFMCLYVAFGLMIIILFIFSRITREMAIRLSIMFVCFSFLQPIVVAITTVGVLVIHEMGLFLTWMWPGSLLYAALLCILLYVACSVIFGTQRIRNLIGATEQASEKIIKVVV